MFIFSPARKKRLRTNTGCFPAEWLNQTSREARRRKERLERAQERKAKKIIVTGCYQRRKPLPIHHLPATEPPTEKALLLPTAKHRHSATDAPQSARKGATGIILYMAKQGAEKRFYEPHRKE